MLTHGRYGLTCMSLSCYGTYLLTISAIYDDGGIEAVIMGLATIGVGYIRQSLDHHCLECMWQHLNIITASGIAPPRDVKTESLLGRGEKINELYGTSGCICDDVEGNAPRILPSMFSWVFMAFNYGIIAAMSLSFW